MNKQPIISPKQTAPYIDHTMLRPQAGKAELEGLCQEAAENNFAAVCILPYHIAGAVQLLKDSSSVRVCSVAGFPLGANHTEIKRAETERAIGNDAGAERIGTSSAMTILNELHKNKVLIGKSWLNSFRETLV